MWPFSERRRSKRWKVAWEASLICRGVSGVQTVQVAVEEVSFSGVRLQLQRMQVGPYHLLVGDTPEECLLAIDLPQGLVKSAVRFQWYNQSQSEGFFVVGAELVNMEPESRQTLKLAIRGL